MFPVSDFNFVVAGIATFAATVGYACTRRLSTNLSGPDADLVRETLASQRDMSEKTAESPLSDEPETTLDANLSQPPPVYQTNVSTPASTPVRKGSLKRKVPHDGFDEPEKEVLGYPHNLANIYPNKRSRTPSADSEATTPNATPSTTLDSIISLTSDQDIDIPMVSHDPLPIVATPAPEPPRTPSPVPEELSPREPSPTPAPASPAPMAVSTPQPATPRDITPRPVTPKPFASPSSGFAAFAAFAGSSTPMNSRPITPKPFASPSTGFAAFAPASPSGGFAAFAGSSSPFVAISKPKQSSSKSSRSIWSSGDLATHLNEDEPSEVLADAFKPLSKTSHAISEAKATSLHPTEKYTHVTGEEDEDVELEQKGVKLYIKRGSKPFSDGIAGHVKLLSNRSTLEERILFRREPLWKVSMNVRVKPSVRCTYVPEENVLRLILKETIENSVPGVSTTEAEVKQEVVIYALKPGRSCSKQDFKDFAETLMKSSHFKTSSSTDTSP